MSQSHAGQLLDEAREAELRRRKRVAILQAEQDEWHQQRAAQVWRGLPVDQMPAGVTATEVMLQAAAADMPKRRVSPVEEALGGSGMTTTACSPCRMRRDRSRAIGG